MTRQEKKLEDIIMIMKYTFIIALITGVLILLFGGGNG